MHVYSWGTQCRTHTVRVSVHWLTSFNAENRQSYPDAITTGGLKRLSTIDKVVSMCSVCGSRAFRYAIKCHISSIKRVARLPRGQV